MRTRVVAAVLLAAWLLSSCGNDDSPSSQKRAAPPVTSEVSITVPALPGLSVELTLEGKYERDAVHMVRVERPDGSLVFERMLEERTMTAPLEPGDYRLLSFQRICKSECEAEPDPADLGPPVDVCGSYFAVQPGEPTRATVKVVANEGCEVGFG